MVSPTHVNVAVKPKELDLVLVHPLHRHTWPSRETDARTSVLVVVVVVCVCGKREILVIV